MNMSSQKKKLIIQLKFWHLSIYWFEKALLQKTRFWGKWLRRKKD